MSWRDRFQTGSFRGAEFLIEQATLNGGRRTALHEFPRREKHYSEDLGLKAKTRRIECMVVGADYMQARDALIDALDAQGPGELVHPYQGRMRVQIQDYDLTESTREGGMARFSISFVLAGEQPQPTGNTDTAHAVDAAADDAAAAAADDFGSDFDVDGQPGWVAEDAVSRLDDALASMQVLAGSRPLLAGDIYSVNTTLASLRGTLATAIHTPQTLATDIAAATRDMAALFAPADGYVVMQSLADQHPAPVWPAAATAPRARRQQNGTAIAALFRRAARIEQARISAGYETDSSARAIDLRNRLSEALDAEACVAADDVYLAIMDLRAAMVSDLTARAAMLPQVAAWTPPATLPALALAQRIYGDGLRDQDIVSRNDVRHPGFVPGGRALEVLHA